MRLWSLHPQYLDAKGLVALWRESLLAKKVLQGLTKGYTQHPQLLRFKAQRKSVQAIDRYLMAVFAESLKRNYSFDGKKFAKNTSRKKITVTQGQLNYELEHLRKKLKKRDPVRFKSLEHLSHPKPHPLFNVIPGKVEKWEKI